MACERLDARYSVRLEFCGRVYPQWVIRFCGEWVASSEGKRDARAIARAHKVRMLQAMGCQ